MGGRERSLEEIDPLHCMPCTGVVSKRLVFSASRLSSAYSTYCVIMMVSLKYVQVLFLGRTLSQTLNVAVLLACHGNGAGQ